MPSPRRSKRRSFPGRSKSISQHFPAIQGFLSRSRQSNHQQQKQRRQRQLRQFKSPTPRHAAALLMRHGATALLLLIAISTLLNSMPIQLLSPGWYLQILGYFGEKVPEFILAATFSMLSIAFGSDNETNRTYCNKVSRSSQVGYVIVLLLLPVQLVLAALLFGQYFTNQSNQLKTTRANTDSLISAAQQIQKNDEFVAFLKSRNITANFDSVTSAPLIQVKSEFVSSMRAIQQKQIQKINSNARSALLGLTINVVKLFTAFIILAGFFRIFRLLLKGLPYQPLQTADHSQ